MEQTLGALNRKLRELQEVERDKILDELQPMLNKCFMKEDRRPDGSVMRHYACINGYPMVRNFKTGQSFNQYQLPAIHFFLGERCFAAYEKDEEGHGQPVFWFDTIFTGELPDPYKRGATDHLNHKEWVEIDRSVYIAAMERRFSEFKANLFSITTPPA